MKAAGILLVCAMSALVTGCASKATNERPKAAMAQEEKQRVADNWDQLRPGMTLDEVEAVLGPIDADYKAFIMGLVVQKTPGVKITFDNGPHRRLNKEYGDPDGHLKSTYTYYTPYYILTFDWQGKLSEFALR